MTNPITTTPRRSKAFGLLLKAAVVIPDLVIASLLWLMIMTLLPPAIGVMAAVLGITLAVLVAAGLGEDAIVRILCRARCPNGRQAPRLAVAWRIAAHHLNGDGVSLRIVTHGPPVATAGRRHLLMRRDIVDAYCANDLTAHHVAAIMAEGVGRLRHGHTRFDLLWTVWGIPWDLIRGLAQAIERHLGRIPLVRFAWLARVLVGGVAVVLEARAGRWPAPIVLAVIIALSYAMPCCRQLWEFHLGGMAEEERTAVLTRRPRVLASARDSSV